MILRLHAPLDGWVLPLRAVPDPVFAGGMAGDGVAIEPTAGVLVAPCDGEVALSGEARHAVIVRTECGIDVLVHVGIETVAMGGQGFELQVVAGQRVRTGEVLLRFDLDRVARRARSCITPVLAAAGGRVVHRVLDRRVARGDVLMDVEAGEAGSVQAPETTLRRRFLVPFEHGLHARPAAQLAAVVRPHEAVVTVHAQGRRANAASTTALMALGVRCGDTVEVAAAGRDAAAALAALAAVLPDGEAPRARVVAVRRSDPGPPVRVYAGAVAAPGLALGPVVQLDEAEPPVDTVSRGDANERAALETALEVVRAHLQALAERLPGEAGAVFAAHSALADDPELMVRARDAIAAGASAAVAWRTAVQAVAETLVGMDDARLRERAADLHDLQRQVLRSLSGRQPSMERPVPDGAILVVDELLPSQLAAMAALPIAGIAMARGGTTSHVALLAAARGIPVLVGLGEGICAIPDGTTVLLDAERGELDAAPEPERRASLERMLARRARRERAELAAAPQPSMTRDGVVVCVRANLGAVADAGAARDRGAEGCGLLRTEFLFLERACAPDEDEQARCYAEIARALAPHPVTVRLLDIGGDKPIAYLPLPREDNPALGLRGVRIDALRRDLLRTQLRAVLRAASATAGTGSLRILLPMLTELSELRAMRGLLGDCATELGLSGPLPQVGAMIETPAAALLAGQLAAEAAFLSIGSNDLAQYTLAMDRGHATLAARLDPLHPAVLRLIAMVARAGRDAGCSVSVCGGMASDPLAVPLLLGLGIHELSVVPALLPRIRQRVRELDGAACEAIAGAALEQSDAAGVRALAARELADRAADVDTDSGPDDSGPDDSDPDDSGAFGPPPLPQPPRESCR